ncbi:MAG: matrixin family metalloprotease [Balneolaceae bacterium]|nr:matrixin family metalloprotease [Balneolaceae bacterium]
MKHIQAFLILFLVLVVAGIALIQSNTTSPDFISYGACDQPLTYRIEHIDKRYNIDKAKVIEAMRKVNSAWSDAVGKNLLVYRKTGKVGIHLIYSEEQHEIDSERQLLKRIENEKQRYEEMKKSYQELTSTYNSKLEQYKKNLSEFNELLENYNAKVSSWNAKGGVPKENQQDLKVEKMRLDQLKNNLDQQRQSINELGQKVNRFSERLNSQAEQQNALVYHYNKRFNKEKKFNQGNYINAGGQKKIYIYQFDDFNNLKMVLAHEVGHALGLDHVDNPSQ